MKNILIISLFCLLPVVVLANLSPVKPFGGRVLTAPIPGAACPTSLQPTSPFWLNTPLGIKMGPYAEVPGPQTFGSVVPSAWMLGLYSNIPIPDCFVGVPGVGQVPVYKAFLFGTSIPGAGL